eukprot:9491605-Pyramimonas_sp.AAC.1
MFAEKGDPEYSAPFTRGETKEEKKERIKTARALKSEETIKQGLEAWDPQKVDDGYQSLHKTTDPYKTLFVSRINYDTSESKLKREFEEFGAIKRIKM